MFAAAKFFSHILPVLKAHLTLCNRLTGSCPLSWNKILQRLVSDTESASFKLQQTLHFWYMNLYLVAQLLALPTYMETLTFPRLMICIFFIWALFLGNLFRWSVTLYASDFAKLLNAIPLLEIGQNQVIKALPALSHKQVRYEVILQWLMIFGTQTSLAFPMIMFGYLINPCFPPYWGAIIFLDKTGVCHITNSLVPIALMVFLWLQFTASSLTFYFPDSHPRCF
ncbi:hypothetical protein Fcan01_18037 [Folsomia candida]|uniref:Uncharacterized protein n=1 Tax=Folsomia candida TaxID=158441 RepID=A0A226DRG2_FOLCA|nr:hypothetical protein Fcan01_18037 [Folsomia candida]